MRLFVHCVNNCYNKAGRINSLLQWIKQKIHKHKFILTISSKVFAILRLTCKFHDKQHYLNYDYENAICFFCLDVCYSYSTGTT